MLTDGPKKGTVRLETDELTQAVKYIFAGLLGVSMQTYVHTKSLRTVFLTSLIIGHKTLYLWSSASQ